MNKFLSIRLLLFTFSIVTLFSTGCKKTSTPPVSITPPRAPQQGKIVYFSYTMGPNTYEIWTANYDGSNAGKVNITLPANVKLSGNSTPKISWDNKKIYFNANLTDGGLNILGSGLYSCDIDGSNTQQLVSGDANGIPVISGAYYEGQQGKFLFEKIVNGVSDIYSANLDGSGQQKINVVLPINAYIPSGRPVVISPDGKTILFTVSLTNSEFYIYSCSVKGGNIQQITNGTSGYSFFMGDSYTQGGQQTILFSNYAGFSTIHTANLDGSNAQKINITLPAEASIDVSGPKISPDGKTIFFNTTGLNGLEYGVYSCNIDGSNLKQILQPASRYELFFVGEAF